MPAKIIKVRIDDLKPTEKNPRQITKGDFERLKAKMKKYPKFLEAREIVVDEDLRILGGHQRVRVLKQEGKQEIEVKQVIGWTDEEKDNFILDDNITDGDWDWDIIANEWDEDVLDDAGLEIKMAEPHDYYGDERERTYKEMNLAEFDNTRSSGKYQIPTLAACDYVPEKLIGFNEAKSATDFDTGVHFFIDDYQFERIWRAPKKYIEMLSRFECIFTPDFSLYMDMPLAMKIWNVYRSRLIGQMAQDLGLRVIPTLVWAGDDTLDFAFDGLPKNSTVAVSTVGVMRDENSRKIWQKGMRAALKALEPKQILLYGSEIDFDFGGVDTKTYSAKRFTSV